MRIAYGVLTAGLLFWASAFAVTADAATQPPPSGGNPGGNTTPSDNSGKSTTIANDLTNYEGDRIRFESDLIVGVQAVDGTLLGYVCMPKGTKLEGEQGYTAGSEVGTLFKVQKTPKEKKDKNGPKDKGEPEDVTCDPNRYPKDDPNKPIGVRLDDKTTAIFLKASDIIRVTNDQMSSTPPDRNGLTYGVLAVPFKYHFQGNKDIGGSASLGPYAGYRTTRENGLGLSYVAFVGASNISVTQTVDGKQTTQTLAGLSYGGGVVATFKGKFQLGAVLGVDQVSKSANYQYNGKVWLAIELGYAFLQ